MSLLGNWLLGVFGVGLMAYFVYVIYDGLRYAIRETRYERKTHKAREAEGPGSQGRGSLGSPIEGLHGAWAEPPRSDESE